MKFKIENEIFSSSRKCSDQGKINLNGKTMSIKEFNDFMGYKLFNLKTNDYKYLKYRELISRFIRPGKYSYNSYDKFIYKEREYTQNMCNAYLLGLDVSLIDRKKDLITSKQELLQNKKLFEKDDTIKDFFGKQNKIDVSIIDYEQKIKKLDEEIKKFKIAENYYDIKKETDDLQIKLNNIENKLILLNDGLKNIDKSLDVKLDLSKEDIVSMYNEANIYMNDLVLKRLEEVEKFHQKLIENRNNRLYDQKKELKKELFKNEDERKELSNKLNENLKLLNAYGALDVYNSLIEKLNIYKANLQKLNSYKDLLENYNNNINNLNIEIQEENIKTSQYLKEAKGILENNIIIFKKLANNFFPNKLSGISIVNNEGNNQNRYSIEAFIQDDTSDGVNEIKIFCYDFTVLINHYNHNVDFIFHDSRLFANVDPRQRKDCILLANEYSKKYNFQYIASMNEDFLDTIRGITQKDEYEEIKKIIEDNKILSLTDDFDEGKLLGIQINLKYDK